MFGAGSGDPGNGQNGNGGTNENIENGLQVTASTTVINADGQDAARINVYYDKVKLSLDAVALRCQEQRRARPFEIHHRGQHACVHCYRAG